MRSRFCFVAASSKKSHQNSKSIETAPFLLYSLYWWRSLRHNWLREQLKVHMGKQSLTEPINRFKRTFMARSKRAFVMELLSYRKAKSDQSSAHPDRNILLRSESTSENTLVLTFQVLVSGILYRIIFSATKQMDCVFWKRDEKMHA